MSTTVKIIRPTEKGWGNFLLTVDGEDLVCRGIKGTWFNDFNTASGITAARGRGCALPVDSDIKELSGSPVPHLPWQTTVRVYSHKTNKSIEVPLIDVGPAKATGHRIDLTKGAFMALGLDIEDGVGDMDFRIIGGAKYLPK